MTKVRFLTKEITLPANTAEGTYTVELDPDTDLDFIDGVQIFEMLDGGLSYFNLGIEDNKKVYNSIVHKNDYISSVASPINERYKHVMIPITTGVKLRIKVELPAQLQSELKFQVSLRHKSKE